MTKSKNYERVFFFLGLMAWRLDCLSFCQKNGPRWKAVYRFSYDDSGVMKQFTGCKGRNDQITDETQWRQSLEVLCRGFELMNLNDDDTLLADALISKERFPIRLIGNGKYETGRRSNPDKRKTKGPAKWPKKNHRCGGRILIDGYGL